MNWDNKNALLVFGGYLIAAVFIFAGAVLRSKYRRQVKSALKTSGKVVSLEASASMGSESFDRVFHPVFTFTDNQGVEHQVRSEVGTSPASHEIGDSVEVYYQPKSPHGAVIDPKENFKQPLWICFVVGSVAAIAATIYLLVTIR